MMISVILLLVVLGGAAIKGMLNIETFEEMKKVIGQKIQTLSGYLCDAMPFLNNGKEHLLKEKNNFYKTEIDYLKQAPENV